MNTYKIIRKHFDISHPDNNKVIDSGLTLDEAQAHCSKSSTSGEGWMDVFYNEWKSSHRKVSFLEKLCMLQSKVKGF